MAMAMAMAIAGDRENHATIELVDNRFHSPQPVDPSGEANDGDDEDDGTRDRSFLRLCTLFVATIEDAKDRISQLELVFCNQLFPAFQRKISRPSSPPYLRGDQEKTSPADMDDECRSKRECLLLQELRALRDERDSLLNREEDRSRLLSAQISKVAWEAECWKKKHDDVLSELQDLNKERDSLRSERAIVFNKQKGALRAQDDVEKEKEEGRNLLLQQANDWQAFNSRSDYLEELHNVRNEWTSLMKKLDDQTQTRVRTDDLREQQILQPNQKIQVAEVESKSLCTRINELNQYLLRGAEESIRKIRTLESESESLRTVIGELRQQLDRQAEEPTGKIQAPSSEFDSLHSKMHDLQQQLNEANGSEQKVQKAHSESSMCVSKLQQENLDLYQRCSQLSSELNKLKAKMQFCSSSLSGSSEKESNLKMVKHEEMSCDFLKRQFVSEMEKARNAKQALLNKLNTLKKSYRSLRKQYTVLFRRTHTMELHHKDAVFLSANGRKYHYIDRAETENGTHTNDDQEESKGVSNWRSPERCIEPLSSIQSKLMQNEDDADQLSRDPLISKHKTEIVPDTKLGESILKDVGMATFSHCSPQQKPYPLQNENSGKHSHQETTDGWEDDISLKSAQDLASKEQSGKKDLHEEGVFEHRIITLDEVSQVGSTNVHPVNLLQPNPNTRPSDMLVEVVESCSPERFGNTQESQMPTSFAPLRASVLQAKIDVRDELRPIGNVSLPVQKRALSGESNPNPVKSLKTKWRNTRAERTGFDPHDDFLNTPLENALNGNPEKSTKSSERGTPRLESLVDRERKGVSFSQVTTQAPVGHGDGFHEDEDDNEKEKEKVTHEEERKQTWLKPMVVSNLKLKRDKVNVEPLGNPKNDGNILKRDMSRAKLLSLSKPGPMYKYIEPVRKKDDREKLQGVECNQCKKFYDAVLVNNGSSCTARCEHHDGVSRHRYRYVPPSTPEGFWNIGFDSDL